MDLVSDALAAEETLRARLRDLFGAFEHAGAHNVPVMAVVMDEMRAAGVELPPALAMLL